MRSAPPRVKFFAAVLVAGDDRWSSIEAALSEAFSAIDLRSRAFPWSVSRYYEREMGAGLFRRFFSFELLSSPADLVESKHRARSLEDSYRDDASRMRSVNIDPGYLEAGKVVLASTKNANHRIYLGSGIYGEATLAYTSGDFRPYDYTYLDYRWPETREFFAAVRKRYLEERSTTGPPDHRTTGPEET